MAVTSGRARAIPHVVDGGASRVLSNSGIHLASGRDISSRRNSTIRTSVVCKGVEPRRALDESMVTVVSGACARCRIHMQGFTSQSISGRCTVRNRLVRAWCSQPKRVRDASVSQRSNGRLLLLRPRRPCLATQWWNAAATSANTASTQAGDVSLAWKPTSNHWAGAVVYFATGGRCAALVRLGSPSTRIIDAQHADSTSAKLVENAHRQSCWQPQHRTTITLTFTTSRQLPPRAALARRTAMR
jgi:hypothetical protein